MRIKRIESSKNPALKPLLQPKHAPEGSFPIEGPNLLEAALEGGRIALGAVFVTARGLERHYALIERASAIAPELYEIPEHVMERITSTETPQGLIALCTLKAWGIEDLDLNAPIVVLDSLGDPGNVGTIIRTAEAAGAGGVIVLPGTADPYSPKALRASAGSALRVPVVRMEHADDLSKLGAGGFRLLLAEPRGGVPLYEADLQAPVGLVFGNEAHGAGEVTKFMASGSVSLPLMGRAESLNVAAAASVVLYEALRQRVAGGR